MRHERGELIMNRVMEEYENKIEEAKNALDNIYMQREKYERISLIYEKIKDVCEVSFISEKLFIIPKYNTTKDKKGFSYTVERITEALKEYPIIKVEPGQYIAEWEDNNIQLYFMSVTDCKLIEQKEMREVITKKPHPSCIAALSVLEN